MDTPTVDEITTWSKLPFGELDFDELQLEVEVERAVNYVQNATGRDFDTMPDEFALTAQEAVQRRVEQQVLRSQEDVLETAADFDLISNFNVTGYSETRRSAEDAKKAQMINLWPLLNALLWELATDDKKDEWLETWGVKTPAFEVTEIDWQGNDSPYGTAFPGA